MKYVFRQIHTLHPSVSMALLFGKISSLMMITEKSSKLLTTQLFFTDCIKKGFASMQMDQMTHNFTVKIFSVLNFKVFIEKCINLCK